MGKCFVDPNALLAVAGMLAAMANGDTVCVGKEKPTRKTTKPCGCGCTSTQPRDEFGRFTSHTARPVFAPRPVCPPTPHWDVCECEPREDKNKVFGLSVRVDEPTPDMFSSRWAFERAHEKFDRLVDAAEACTWQNKSNTAPIHKVNCIRKSVFEPPVMGINLCGESRWFE